MLWQAGQERIWRESRDRLVELFVAARDAALAVGVSTGQLKTRGTWRLPSYARPDGPPRPPSPAARNATIAKLGEMFPGAVRRADP